MKLNFSRYLLKENKYRSLWASFLKIRNCMFPPDVWEIPSQNQLWRSANNDIKSQFHWLALLFFFQKLDCFSPNEQKNQLPPVDFISAATVFVYLQYPLKTWSWVSCSCFKRGGKWKLFWCKNKKKRGVGGKRGAHREPGLTVTKTFKGSSPLFNTLAFEHLLL